MTDSLVLDLAADMYTANTSVSYPKWDDLPTDGLTRARYVRTARRLIDAGWTRRT